MNPTRAFRPRIVLARNQLCRRHIRMTRFVVTAATTAKTVRSWIHRWCNVTEKSIRVRSRHELVCSDDVRGKKTRDSSNFFTDLRSDDPVSTNTHGPNAGRTNAGDVGRSESFLVTPLGQATTERYRGGEKLEVRVIRFVWFQVSFSLENVPSTNTLAVNATSRRPFVSCTISFQTFAPSFYFRRPTASDRGGRINGNDTNIDLVFRQACLTCQVQT